MVADHSRASETIACPACSQQFPIPDTFKNAPLAPQTPQPSSHFGEFGDVIKVILGFVLLVYLLQGCRGPELLIKGVSAFWK